MSSQCSRIDLVIRADIAATCCASREPAAALAMAPMLASESIRSFSRATTACFDPMLSYTVWAETPAACAMSRTLVRVNPRSANSRRAARRISFLVNSAWRSRSFGCSEDMAPFYHLTTVRFI